MFAFYATGLHGATLGNTRVLVDGMQLTLVGIDSPSDLPGIQVIRVQANPLDLTADDGSGYVGWLLIQTQGVTSNAMWTGLYR